jgi:hypothetical protein
MRVNEYLPNFDVEAPVWFYAFERFYRPWKMAYFWPFSNVISIKTSCAARKKYLQHGGDRRWRNGWRHNVHIIPLWLPWDILHVLSTEYISLYNLMKGVRSEEFELSWLTKKYITFWPLLLLKFFFNWWWLLSPRAGHRNYPKHLRLSKPIDMTIHWKALEEHSLMVPLVFRFNHFRGGEHFLNFLQ